jgi:hypothetical protein
VFVTHLRETYNSVREYPADCAQTTALPASLRPAVEKVGGMGMLLVNERTRLARLAICPTLPRGCVCATCFCGDVMVALRLGPWPGAISPACRPDLPAAIRPGYEARFPPLDVLANPETAAALESDPAARTRPPCSMCVVSAVGVSLLCISRLGLGSCWFWYGAQDRDGARDAGAPGTQLGNVRLALCPL